MELTKDAVEFRAAASVQGGTEEAAR